MSIEDTVHRYLLDHGYSRASLVSQPLELPIAGTRAKTHRPAFAVMNPESGSILAVIDIAHNESSEQLAARVRRTAAYTRELDGASLQGYVVNIRQNEAGGNEINFVQVYPEFEHRVISAQRFPDLETLMVFERLKQQQESTQAVAATSPGTVDDAAFLAEPDTKQPLSRARTGFYLLAAAMVLLALIDLVVLQLSGNSLLTVQQTLLLLTGCVFLSLPLFLQLAEERAAAVEPQSADLVDFHDQ